MMCQTSISVWNLRVNIHVVYGQKLVQVQFQDLKEFRETWFDIVECELVHVYMYSCFSTEMKTKTLKYGETFERYNDNFNILV